MDGLIWVLESLLINSIHITHVWRAATCTYDNITWTNVIKPHYISNHDTECCAILLYLILFTASGLNHDLTIFHAAMAMKNKAREVSKHMIETVLIMDPLISTTGKLHVFFLKIIPIFKKKIIHSSQVRTLSPHDGCPYMLG